MKVPGFTGEEALGKTIGKYRGRVSRGLSGPDGMSLQQYPGMEEAEEMENEEIGAEEMEDELPENEEEEI
ncbi:MAG: hypothetical protein JSW64_08140 [Candidatus Zixiibacteriota bacterium]|nr:MAG: hypothetical protein JSW64_08140 [candidate division Zixibacteria bacterium]